MEHTAFISFEYDEHFFGGQYFGVGNTALVPLQLCEDIGPEAAFQKTTGIDPIHLINFNMDEPVDKDGYLIDPK